MGEPSSCAKLPSCGTGEDCHCTLQFAISAHPRVLQMSVIARIAKRVCKNRGGARTTRRIISSGAMLKRRSDLNSTQELSD
jgi:hypothetical protein